MTYATTIGMKDRREGRSCASSCSAISVAPISTKDTKPWILNKHYAKRMPSISYAYGAFIDGVMKGIVTYGSPASPFLAKGVCGEMWRCHVIELNRLVTLRIPNLPSKLIAKSLKMIPKPKIVVSYADTAQGHIGTVYKATNWIYTGATKERTDMFSESGHSRHNAGDSQKRQFRSSKHRYVFFVGSKTERKQMLRNLNYEILKYPEGESSRYDDTGLIITQDFLI